MNHSDMEQLVLAQLSSKRSLYDLLARMDFMLPKADKPIVSV